MVESLRREDEAGCVTAGKGREKRKRERERERERFANFEGKNYPWESVMRERKKKIFPHIFFSFVVKRPIGEVAYCVLVLFP